jgi:hypothetical protein
MTKTIISGHPSSSQQLLNVFGLRMESGAYISIHNTEKSVLLKILKLFIAAAASSRHLEESRML